MAFYLDFIADYGEKTGVDDLAFSEVNRRLMEEFVAHGMPFPVVKNLAVNPFNTIETGFVVAQLAHNSRLGGQHIIYHNTAPRKDELAPRSNNAGEFLAVAELPNGVRIIGVYGGYSFSFLEVPVYRVKCAADGSQFRSRDVFPPCVAALAEHACKPLETWKFLGERVDNVPSVPENIICSIDGYGNIKTNAVLKEGITTVQINDLSMSACVGSGIFSAQDGSLVVAPGSSGWHNMRCVEVCLRGGSAAKKFNHPEPGDKIILR